MKLFLLLTLIGSFAVAAPDISGTVTISKDLQKTLAPTGVLFIIARPAGSPTAGVPPTAVLRIPGPKFPQKFSIGSANSMMGGKFEGAMSITARYSPTGNALDKSGPQGSVENTKPGKTDLKIELKSTSTPPATS